MNEEIEAPIEVPSVNAPEPVKKPTVNAVPKWEQTAKARVTAGLKKLFKPTVMLKEKDAAEADTRHLVTDILVDVLGYDKYENLTAEFSVKGDWADYGIRIDKQLEAFIEVKRISQKLSASHLKQVESYALKEGVQWAILTNAQVWQAYHVMPVRGQQSEVTLIFEIDILDESMKPSQKTDLMFLISKEGLSKGRLAEYLSAQNAISPKTLAPILLSDDVLATIRKEVKRKTKHTVDPKELKQAVERLITHS
jgi:predicted type IV restriction endonuclease